MAKPDRLDAAYTVDCPLCKMPKGERCVYMTPAYVGPYTTIDPKWGTPTQRPHNPRLYRRWEVDKQVARRAFYKSLEARLADPVAAERRALADLARREHDEMRTWLRRYGRIFWTEI